MSASELGKHDHTLLAVISQYQTMAMVSLGKVQNPMTGKMERDLDQAHLFIDILEMLKVKCRTDTPEEILRMLDSAVMDLHLNYLDEKKKGDEPEKEENSSETADEDANPAETQDDTEGGAES